MAIVILMPILSNAKVTLCGKNVILDSGFKVEKGAEFKTEVYKFNNINF